MIHFSLKPLHFLNAMHTCAPGTKALSLNLLHLNHLVLSLVKIQALQQIFSLKVLRAF